MAVRSPVAQAIRTAAFPAAIILLLIGLSIHWAHAGYYIAAVDINVPEFPWNQVRQCVMPWNYSQSYLGQPSWCVAWAPAIVLHASLASALGGSLAETLMLVLPYAVAAAGAFACARYLGLSNVAAFAGAIAYTFNPFTQIMIGVNPVIPILTALLAWVCALLVLAARRPEARRACTIGLVAIAAIGVNMTVLTPHSPIDLVIASVIWLAVAMAFCQDRREYLRWLVRTVGLMFLASLWWLFPAVVSIASAENTHAITVAGNAWTFARSSLLNNMRFNAVWMWQYEAFFPNAASYDWNVVTYPAAFFFVFVLFAAAVRLRGVLLRVAGILSLAALCMMLVSKGPHEPFGAISSAILSLPMLFALQDPGGLVVIGIFFLSIVTALVVDDFARANARAPVYAATIVTILALCSTAQLLSGDIFHGPTRVATSMYVRVPDYWYALSKDLASDPRPGGVVFLPENGGYQATYAWGYSGADVLPSSSTMRRSMVLAPPFGYFITSQRTAIYDKVSALLEAGSPIAGSVLRDLGVRFLVIRGDVIDYGPKPTPAYLGRIFPGAPIRQFGPLTLVDLGTPRPLIADSTTWINEKSDATAGQLLELGTLLGDTRPRVDSGPRPAGSAVLSEVSADGTIDNAASAKQRAVVTDPTVPWYVWLKGSAPLYLAMNFLRRPAASLPNVSPFFYEPEAPVARAPRARPFLTFDGPIPPDPYAVLNPGDARNADLLVRCNDCAPGQAVGLVASGTRYTATTASDSGGSFNLRFTGVRFDHGRTKLSFALPRGASVHTDDVAFDGSLPAAASALPLIAYYDVRARLFDHPALVDPNVETFVRKRKTQFVIFLQTGNALPVACPVAIDTLRSFDLYYYALDCFYREGQPTDALTVANTSLVGVGVTSDSGRAIRHGVTNLVLMLDPGGYQFISSKTGDAQIDRATHSAFEITTLDQPLGPGDVVDYILPNAATSLQPQLVALPGNSSWPFLPADTGSIVARSAKGSASTLVARVRVPSAIALGQASVYLWHPINDWVLTQGAVPAQRFVPASSSAIEYRLPRAVDVASDGAAHASIAAVGPQSVPDAPVQSCDAQSDLPIFHCAAEARSVVVLNIGYHWTWLAFQGLRPLPHARADGWRNAWIANDRGSVTIVNLLDIVTPLLALATLAGFAFLLLRAPRKAEGSK